MRVIPTSTAKNTYSLVRVGVRLAEVIAVFGILHVGLLQILCVEQLRILCVERLQKYTFRSKVTTGKEFLNQALFWYRVAFDAIPLHILGSEQGPEDSLIY